MFEKRHIEKIREPQSLPDYVHEAIKEAIITGRISAGTRLKQMEIAEELNVSQQTVREALTTLVATGLVEQNPHRGFEVTHIPLKEQKDIYKLRALLETFALAEVMDEISAEDLAHMRELLPQTASPDGSLSADHVRKANRTFHMLPVLATQNRHLIRILEQLWDITWTYYSCEDVEKLKSSAVKELEQHAAIIDALEKKELLTAQNAVILHIKEAFESVCEYMEDRD